MSTEMLIHVKAETDQLRTEARAGRHYMTLDEPKTLGGEDTGPNPLQALLSALAGCENVIANIVAKEMNFDLQGISFDLKGTIDLRGLMGDPAVKTYFEKVIVEAKVKTCESQERLQQLVETTEKRCPVFSILRDAGIEVEQNWIVV